MNTTSLINEFKEYISSKSFPCIGAKTSLAKNRLHCMVAGNIACPTYDNNIIVFLYQVVDNLRKADNNFYSAAIIFTGPDNITENLFEHFLWQRLQALSNIDALQYSYDKRVSQDATSPDFSFSLKEEAFFIVGMHPNNSRVARRFKYPVLIFNPHAQFIEMKATNKYAPMQRVVRKRDIALSGTINPMLNNFGKASEILQYSGKNYTLPHKCPLQINHG